MSLFELLIIPLSWCRRQKQQRNCKRGHWNPLFFVIPMHPLPVSVWFRRYILILKVVYQFTRRKQENKDLFVDIVIDSISCQLILVIKPFLCNTCTINLRSTTIDNKIKNIMNIHVLCACVKLISVKPVYEVLYKSSYFMGLGLWLLRVN